MSREAKRAGNEKVGWASEGEENSVGLGGRRRAERR